ncbi:MAG TPA: hypothetical protein VKZ79_02620 [Alphaproteobacteria bacterium]|nr:hypothetical protein [Alphaproteobacteria bacterium]
MASNQQNGPRFQIDDFVYFSPQNAASRGGQPAERFVVVGILPPDRAGSYQYRIRPTASGPHRVATELELRR